MTDFVFKICKCKKAN